MRRTEVTNNEAGNLARAIQAQQDDLSTAAARALLKLTFIAAACSGVRLCSSES
jgi:hypothetical protein